MTSGRIALACLMVLVAGSPLVLPDFYITLLNYIGLYSIVALALVLLTGVAGLTATVNVTDWPKTAALLRQLGADVSLGVDGRTMLRRYIKTSDSTTSAPAFPPAAPR